LASLSGTVLSGPDSMIVSGRVVSTSGLNHGSAPMAEKAAIDSSDVSILRSSLAPSAVVAGATVESYTTASIPDRLFWSECRAASTQEAFMPGPSSSVP